MLEEMDARSISMWIALLIYNQAADEEGGVEGPSDIVGPRLCYPDFGDVGEHQNLPRSVAGRPWRE